MRRIAGIDLAAAVAAGMALLASCNTATPVSFEEQKEEFASIAYLKSLCRGTSSAITQQMKIRGVVTANDIQSEFPKTLVIEDATAGIGIAVDHTTLYKHFPLGSAVTVYCTGLAVGDYGGKVQLGARPAGDYSVDRIARTDIDRYIRCTEPNAHARRPPVRQFREIMPSDADRYVSFENVRFAEAGEAWCGRDPETGETVTTLRTLLDGEGNSFPVRVLSSCHYAMAPIPCGTGAVNGIIDYFNGELSLRIINFEIRLATFEAPPKAYLSTGRYSVPKQTR